MSKNEIPFSTTLLTWNVHGEGSRSAYRSGYFNAADILARELFLSTESSPLINRYSIIYPVLLLYRHFIELSLKDYIDLAIFIGITIKKDPTYLEKQRERIGHNLQRAYQLVIDIADETFGNSDFIDESCKDTVNWLHDLDKNGDGFRYALNRKKEAQFSESYPVDLPELRKEIRNFESCMYDELKNLRSLLDETVDSLEMGDRTYFW